MKSRSSPIITATQRRIFGSLHRKREICESIDLTITVPDEAQAKTVCNNWRKVSEIYEFVMKELL